MNAIRVEGKVGDRKKVLYLFSDFHADIGYETKCTDLRAVDFQKYLVDTFDSITRDPIDFFFEQYPDGLIPGRNSFNIYKEKYIHEVAVMFSRSFNFDPKQNKITTSTEFPNVRLHYIDPREYLFGNLNPIYNNTFKLVQLRIDGKYQFGDLQQLKDGINIASAHIMTIYDYLYKNTQDKKDKLPIIPPTIDALSKYTDKQLLDIGKQMLDKILSKYKNDSIKKKILSLVNSKLKDQFKDYFEYVIKLTSFIDKNEDRLNLSHIKFYHDKDTDTDNYGLHPNTRTNLTNELDNLHSDIYEKYSQIAAFLVDLYFLRRYLDKNYVTNGIVYTGGYHTANYVYHLIKDFGFKITHYSYLKYESDKVESIIKNIKPNKSMFDTFSLISPPIRVQCSNVGEFPEKFQ